MRVSSHIPREQGFCFQWDDSRRMHAYIGRWLSLKIDARKQKSADTAREKWDQIFAKAAENGTNGSCPDLSAEEALQVIRDINGTLTSLKEFEQSCSVRRDRCGTLLTQAPL